MKFNKEDWVVGRKYRFIGGDIRIITPIEDWIIGGVYTLDVIDFTDNTGIFKEICFWQALECFEPVREPEMNKLYVVASVRKSDGAVFLKDSSHKPYKDFELAKKEVERCASTQSSDYVYYVYELLGIMSAEKEFPPVKTKWF